MKPSLSIALILSIGASLLSGCSTMPAARHAELESQALPLESWAKTQKTTAPPVYRLQVSDVIDVRFPQVPELNESITLRPDGLISMTWIGDVQAVGRTPNELATELRAAYRGVLREPRIDVLVRSFQPSRVYIAGEVMRPGELQLLGPISARQAIVRSGDFTMDAQRDTVVVIRQGNDRPEYILLDFYNSNESRVASAGFQPCSDRNPLACDGMTPMDAEGFQLEPMDMVFVAKTHIAGVAQFFERYVNQILPIYRNMGISANYLLNNQTSRVIVPAN